IAIKFTELRKEHSPQRDIDSDPEGVRSTNNLEQTLLGQLFNQETILGEHACVVHANPVWNEASEFFAKGAVQLDPFEFIADLLLLLAGQKVETCETLSMLGRGTLGKVHNVNRHLALF